MLAAQPKPVENRNCRITACRGHASTEQQLGGSTAQALRRDFVFGAFQTNIIHLSLLSG
jgi:hypothetical protein